MKQASIHLLKALTILLCLSSTFCYHTADVVDSERGVGLAGQKRVPGTLQNGKTFYAPKKTEVGQQGVQGREAAASDGLEEIVPLLRELKKLLDSQDLFPELEQDKKSKIVNMARMATKDSPITQDVIDKWDKLIDDSSNKIISRNDLRRGSSFVLRDAIIDNNEQIKAEFDRLPQENKSKLRRYIETLLNVPDNSYLIEDTMKPLVWTVIDLVLRDFNIYQKENQTNDLEELKKKLLNLRWRPTEI